MDLSIFTKPDPSGRMYKESYLSKNFPEEYDYIIGYSNANGLMDIPFRERVYLCLNNIISVPTCKNPNCSNFVKYKNSRLGYFDYCSNKCISSDPNIKKIKIDKSIEKWGTKTPSESKIIKDKIIKTNLGKYGANSPMCSTDIKEKSKNTLYNNWGVYNPSHLDIFLEKRINSFKKSNYRENFKKTSIERYGVENPLMLKEIHDKSVSNTFIRKNEKLLNIISEKVSLYDDYKLISIDYSVFKRRIFIFCNHCNSEFEINREDFYFRHKNKTTICTICNPINSYKSGSEMALYNYIKLLYNGEIVSNTKSVIHPKELDVYLPDLNIAFEFNGLYWHSEHQKGKFYHRDKMIDCSKVGIDLINIWEDDWMYKNDIIKSIISNRLLKNNHKIYARNCVIKELYDNSEVNNFLDYNHILGRVKSKIKLGLFNNNCLVSLMCFSVRSDGFYELSRFCNKIDTTVVGSSSKLFNFFVNKYKPSKIISYSDNSIFSGDVYEKLGFTFNGETSVNYKWVIDKKRMHKSNYRKDRLVKLGYDPNKSESDIMVDDVGSYKVWDCGLKRWIWTNN